MLGSMHRLLVVLPSALLLACIVRRLVEGTGRGPGGSTSEQVQACHDGWEDLGFAFHPTVHYERYFDENSTLAKSQIGNRTGPADIREYASLVFAVGPYIERPCAP
eukprot:8255646-Pyramimonas_sp.AAC.3